MTVPTLLDRGGCADIFVLSQDRVLKAFRRRAHTNDIVHDWIDHDSITRAQFRAEARAYERLRSLHNLEIYAPKYFGRVDPVAYLDPDAPADKYVPFCGILLELVPGRALKLAHLEPSVEVQVAVVVEQLRDALGLDQVWDASCFTPGSRAPFTVIDFAYWNAEEYEMALAERGVLTKDERTKLERENAD